MCCLLIVFYAKMCCTNVGVLALFHSFVYVSMADNCLSGSFDILITPTFFLLFLCRLEMPKDEMPNHNCIKHLRSVVQQQQTKIADLEKTAAEHKHQLAEQV